jgi:hypothetical protein
MIQGDPLVSTHVLEPAGFVYLRPDPTRVVVRPFKPAIEPRDLNPTDKTRANHIVGRVLGLEPDAAEQQLKDVLENFEGRDRNLLEIFETRAVEMEEALAPHAVLTKTQRYLVGAYFLHEYSFEASALFNPSRASRGARLWVLSTAARSPRMEERRCCVRRIAPSG